jgi:hypothetical protein
VYAPRYKLHSYELLPHGARLELERALVKVLILADRLYLRQHPSTPKLYDARPRYLHVEDPNVIEEWQNIPQTLALGTGDCKDLVSWRLAELQEAGEDAHLVVLEYPMPPDTYFHLVVQRPGGAIEDPSRILGMQ